MKNLKLGISALALTVATTVFAQTSNNPWLIGVGAHGVNHMAVQNGGIGDKFGAFDRLFNIGDYHITPPLSKLTVARHLAGPLVLDWQTSVGNVPNPRFNMGKEFMLMTGLGLQLKANTLWNEESWFDPYLRVGASYLRHDYSGVSFPAADAANNNDVIAYDKNGTTTGKANHFATPVGLGSNFWITKNFGLGIQGDYVATPFNDGSNVPNFWQASASLLFRFGQRDRDKDGILDKDDLCPDTPGLPEFQGCPDTDGDGIPDKDDECPEVAGPVENNGCPWPDTDGDGIIDRDDNCPNVPGPAENAGCPWPDTDGDGILDKDDACPTVPGLAQYNGCPKPIEVWGEEATVALENILFNFDKATLRPESNEKLDNAAKIIKDSQGRFMIIGHTDKKGSEAYNLKLSKQRAAAVVQALEARGVNESSLKSMGVGEQDAVVPESASNAEREKDRKVIVKPADAATWDAMKKRDY
ncbi:OmpA family protein [Chryseobacterium sp.]|uniref:OmpA family protein n=1 Tax=Chryseobacterium sp. TaxID=1871047 RepID=UPI0012AA3CE0|nr:OmpA family protein [Chryseobacterium sp.]QFG52345.1 OmpA family protein [Chryseobacterium sp.]